MVKNVIMYAVCTLLMVVTACAEQDQGTASTAAAPAAAPAQRLVQIASLNTAKANDEFTRNVEIMQTRVREIANLNTLLEQEEEMSAQYDIEVQIEELMRRINEDNKLKVEAYRYNLSRKYIRNIEKATVFLARNLRMGIDQSNRLKEILLFFASEFKHSGNIIFCGATFCLVNRS